MHRWEMNITLDREKANHYGIETLMIHVSYFLAKSDRYSKKRKPPNFAQKA